MLGHAMLHVHTSSPMPPRMGAAWRAQKRSRMLLSSFSSSRGTTRASTREQFSAWSKYTGYGVSTTWDEYGSSMVVVCEWTVVVVVFVAVVV
jgi:hypothetical protein